MSGVSERRPRAVIYTRVSLDRTGQGASNERQEAKCRALAELRDWEVVAVEADISKSAYSGVERPAWKRVLKMIREDEVDIVIAWHIDRMTHSMTDLEELILLAEEHNVGVATATGDIDLTTDVGRMVALHSKGLGRSFKEPSEHMDIDILVDGQWERVADHTWVDLDPQ